MQFKLLGVVIQDSLHWKAQINLLALKIARNVGLLSSIKYLLTKDILLLLCNSLILSKIQYGILLWGSTYATHLHPQVTLQKRALCIVSGSSYLAHTKPIAIKLHTLLFNELYEYHISLFMFNVYRKLFNQSLTCLFLLANNLHTYNTCSVDNSFFVP